MYTNTIQSHFDIAIKLEVRRLSWAHSHQASIIDWGPWDTLCIVSFGGDQDMDTSVGRRGHPLVLCLTQPILYYLLKQKGSWWMG